jgi:son of sevenless-like protein
VSNSLITDQERALGTELVAFLVSSVPDVGIQIEKLDDHKNRKMDKAMFTSHGPSLVEIVRHLVMVDSQYFIKLQKKELVSKAWQNEKKSPHWFLLTHQFNQLSLWCQTCILRERDLVSRRQILCYLIEIAVQCIECGGFNCALAIFTSINTHSIQRLKKTWKELPKKSIKSLEILETVFDLRGNYINYRDKLKHTSPVIPCLTIIGRDLFVMEENLPSYTEGGLINFFKFRRIYQLITSTLQYQQVRHRFKKHNDLFWFFANLRGYASEELDIISELIEPHK